MKQYLDLGNRIINEGEWVNNQRTGVNCLTVINADFTYDVEHNQFPMLTTKKNLLQRGDSRTIRIFARI